MFLLDCGNGLLIHSSVFLLLNIKQLGNLKFKKKYLCSWKILIHSKEKLHCKKYDSFEMSLRYIDNSHNLNLGEYVFNIQKLDF